LLVVPVLTRGERSREAVLPDALYLDWDTRELVLGGRRTLSAPLDKLPLLLRAGQIVPLLDERIDTLADEAHPDVVSPKDVSDVYDVVTLLSAAHPEARVALHDGSVLRTHVDIPRLRQLARRGPVDSELSRVDSKERLRDCTGCYWVDASAADQVRLLVSARGGANALGLTVDSTSPRRVRWDVSIALEQAVVERAPETRAALSMTRVGRRGR
jgi:hypothetical protein